MNMMQLSEESKVNMLKAFAPSEAKDYPGADRQDHGYLAHGDPLVGLLFTRFSIMF